MDEFENRVFLLKIAYEKYFSGIDPVEPVRERDDLRRYLRDLLGAPITNGRQRFRLQQLRARWSTLELYWTRNLYQIERGIHPKQRYRADLKDRARSEAELARQLPGSTLIPERPGSSLIPETSGESLRRAGLASGERPSASESSYKAVAYVQARKGCGQNTDIDYNVVRQTLEKQVEALKARTSCSKVKFKVVVEDGKAKVKAVPVR
jgi:hypothetical protein